MEEGIVQVHIITKIKRIKQKIMQTPNTIVKKRIVQVVPQVNNNQMIKNNNYKHSMALPIILSFLDISIPSRFCEQKLRAKEIMQHPYLIFL